MSKKYETGSIHGRFQIFHNDHLAYALKALELSDYLYIGLTSHNIRDLQLVKGAEHRSVSANNPLTYFERTQMIGAALCAENIDRSRFSFIPFPVEQPQLLPDYLPTNIPILTTVREEWNKNKLLIFSDAGYKVEVLTEDFDKQISGSDIRSKIINGDKNWRKLVPSAVANYVDDIDLSNRLRM